MGLKFPEDHITVNSLYLEYLPIIINAFTKGIAIIIPLSPTANYFREIFLDTLLVVEVRILIARIMRYV